MATPLISSETETVSPQALIELEIPGRTGPLPAPPAAPGEELWGVNRGAALDNFPLHGLQIYISAWSAMNVGDSVSVKLNTTTVVATEVIDTSDKVNQRVTTFVPPARIQPGPQTLSYTVKRFGQTDDDSAPTKVLVKLTRPGGQDQDGDKPGHSELRLSLPQEIINDGVDADTAKQGVPVTIQPYPEMAAFDDIKLSWGGQFVTHQVQEPEVGQPIVITVDEATILAAGDSGSNGLAVVFEVYDVVQNRSEDWSQEIRIVVDTGNSRLAAPIVKEAVNSVLDLDKLGTSPVTAMIVAMSRGMSQEQAEADLGRATVLQLDHLMGADSLEDYVGVMADFNLGDKIVVRLTGTTLAGDEVFYEADEVLIDNLPHIYEISIPNLIIRQLAKTQAVFSFRLIHEDGTESKSRGAFINVIGEAVRMEPPVARDAYQGALDPALTSTRIEIPWDEGMAAGDQIVLKWIGTRPDLSIYDPLLPPHGITNGEAASKLPITMTVQGVHLKAIEGGTLELYYLHQKDVNGTIVSRESTRAARLNIGAPRAELPAPDVSGIVDGVMDPALASAILTVRNYTGKAIGDDVHYLWRGSRSGDTTDWIRVNSFNLSNPIDFTIPGSAIAPNDGGTVDASYWVIRAADGRRSDSELNGFRVGQAVVLDPPTISNIKDASNVEIPPGQTTYDTSVTVSGTAPAGESVDVFDGAASKGRPVANASDVWTLNLTGLATGPHPIKAKALYGLGDESAVRSFTVAAMVTPTISNIKDASNVEIPNGQTTYDTSVTVSGTAPAGESVEVFDGSASKGRPVANSSGIWTLPLSSLATGAHPIKAKALYGSGVETAVRSFTVAVGAAPTISNIKDASNVEIPNGQTTYDTSVTVSGTAPAGESVEVFDGSASKGRPVANSSGIWTLALSSLATGAHPIKAKALYGSGVETAVRSFTVAAMVTPTISNIKDASNVEIPADQTTYDTSVTVSGTAPAGESVEVFDFRTSKGKPVANSNGVWTLPLTGLARGTHPIQAKALYGSGVESAVRRFTVVAVTAVAIISVKDSKGNPIATGGTTTDTSVTLEGTVTIS